MNLFLQDIIFDNAESFIVAISSEKNLLCKLASVSKSWRAYEVLKDDYILLKIHN